MEFEQMFIDTAGKPVQYKGETLLLYDQIELLGKSEMILNIESTSSRWRQGVMILFPREMHINIGSTKHLGKRLIFWEDTAPNDIKISWNEMTPNVKVYNAWEVDGQFHSLHNGTAMKKIIKNNVVLYYCNDGYPDEDFDDIVFSLYLG